mmetsp:Transcript_31077/g.90933  ORF Transcript_31077/g.90933 Transcript_31077/m.90933 type:complete len:814 (-) Transcript_31077:24-2465(-)
MYGKLPSSQLGDLTVEFPSRGDSHGPIELVAQSFGEDLFDGDLVPLAPGHGDPRIHVVDLGSTERDLLVVVLVLEIHLGLLDLLVPVLDLLLHLILGWNLLPKVRLRRLELGHVPLLLLGLLVCLGRCDLLLVRLGLFLHLLRLLDGLGGTLDNLLLVLLRGDFGRIAALDQLENLLERLLLRLEQIDLLAGNLQLRLLRLADGLLMVTQNGDLPVGVIVLDHLLCSGQARPGLELLGLAKLILQGLGGVVGTEYLRGEAVHNLLEMCVQCRGGQSMEDLFGRFLLLAEQGEVLVNLRAHAVVVVVLGRPKIDGLLEKHRILTEEFKLNLLIVAALIVGIDLDVFHTKRAATDGIGLLVGILLTADTKGKTIDNPHRRAELTFLQLLGLELLLVACADLVDIVAKESSLAVLGPVGLALEAGLGGKLHVLDLAVDVFVPLAQPLHLGIVAELTPRMAGNTAGWHGGTLRHVESDLLRIDAALDLAHLGMLATTTEGAGGLHVEVSHLLQVTIDEAVAKLELNLLLGRLVDLTLGIGDGLLHELLLIKMSADGIEVALLKVLDDLLLVLVQDGAKVGEPVLFVDRSCLGIAKVHARWVRRREKGGNLLLDGVQVNIFPIVLHLDPMRLVRFRERHTRMLHGVPLTAGGRLRRIPPKEGLHGVLQAVGLLELLELPLLLGGRRWFLLDCRLLLPGGAAAAAALLAGLFVGRGRRLGGGAAGLGLALLLLGGWFEVPVVIRHVGILFVLDGGTLPSTIALAISFGRGGGGGTSRFGVLLFDLFGYRTCRSRGLLFLLLLELPERDIVLTVAAHNFV